MHLITCLFVLVVALPTLSSLDIASAADPLKSSATGQASQKFGMGCSLRCAVSWDISASSMRGIANTNDGNLKTAWIPANKSIGESIGFAFEKNNFNGMENTTFWGIDIINYVKESGWQENARIKKIRIEHNDKRLYEMHLHDMEVQTVRFDPFTIRPGSVVKMVILETYPGTQNQDVAIAEIIPHGAH